METGAVREQATGRCDVFARTTIATGLIVVAIAALAITSLIHSNKRASAQTHLSFDQVQHDWSPSNVVPGFDIWLPSESSAPRRQ